MQASKTIARTVPVVSLAIQGSRRAILGALAATTALLLATPTHAQQDCEFAKLVGSGGAHEHFGISIAMDGDQMAVGAPGTEST